METITNYKLNEFLQLEDIEQVTTYIAILELLEPHLEVPHLRSLSFGNVTSIRENMNYPTIENVLESVKLISKLDDNEILDMEIIEFYSIVNGLRLQAIELSNMEENELASEETSWEMEAVNAGARMSKFGILNIVNSLSGDDVTKWNQIMELPYMSVFTKLRMDKERAAINKEVYELQKKKKNE